MRNIGKVANGSGNQIKQAGAYTLVPFIHKGECAIVDLATESAFVETTRKTVFPIGGSPLRHPRIVRSSRKATGGGKNYT